MNAYRIFLQNEFRSFRRSSLFEQRLVVKILISIGLFLAFIQFGALGFLLAYSFQNISAGTLVMLFVSFYVMDLILKFIFLKPPSGLLYSYLALPIPRRKLVSYSMIKLLIHFTNIAILLFWLPFLLNVYGLQMQTVAMISLVLVSLNANTLLVYLFKTSIRKGLRILAALTLLALSVYVMDIMQLIDPIALLKNYFSSDFLLEKSLVHLSVLAVFWLVLFYMIRGEMYDHSSESVQTTVSRLDKSSFNVFYEWKLLWRNNRYRNTFLIQGIFIGGNFILQAINISNGKSEVVESTFIMSGIFIWLLTVTMAFGQFFFKAESSFISKYLSMPLKMERIISSKLYFSIVMLIIAALIVSPMIFFYADAWKFIASSFLFHAGITTYLFLYRGTFNKSLFEISGRTLFNYQGSDLTFHLPDILMFAELFLVPLLVYLSALAGLEDVQLFLMGISGMVSLAMDKHWKKLIIKNFQKRKYIMYNGILEQ